MLFLFGCSISIRHNSSCVGGITRQPSVSPCCCIQPIGFHGAFSFQVDKIFSLSDPIFMTRRNNQLGRLFRDVNAIPFSRAFQTSSRIHSIPKQLESRPFPSQDSSCNRSRMQSYPDPQVSRFGSQCQLQLLGQIDMLRNTVPSKACHGYSVILARIRESTDGYITVT